MTNSKISIGFHGNVFDILHKWAKPSHMAFKKLSFAIFFPFQPQLHVPWQRLPPDPTFRGFFLGVLHLDVSMYKILKKIGYNAWPDPLINHGFLHRIDIKDLGNFTQSLYLIGFFLLRIMIQFWSTITKTCFLTWLSVWNLNLKLYG